MKISLVFLFSLLNYLSFAQVKVKAYGYLIDMPNTWEITRFDEDEQIYLEGLKASDDSRPTLYIETHPIEKLKESKVFEWELFNTMRECMGTGYNYSNWQMSQRTKRSQFVHNDLEIQEFVAESDPDQDGDYYWVKFWVHQNIEKGKYYFFVAMSDKHVRIKDIDQSKAVENVLKTLRLENAKIKRHKPKQEEQQVEIDD